jgi:hypothetical protein
VRAGVRRLNDLMASAGTDHLPHRLAAAGLGPTGVAGACTLAVAASALAARVGLEAGLAGSLASAMVVITGFVAGEQVLRRRRAALEPPLDRAGRPGLGPRPSFIPALRTGPPRRPSRT